LAKEIIDILHAYKRAQKEGRQAALATVVHVEGSSYRRPGARMLVEDNGRMTGAISGGCLEKDALRKAQHAMSQKQNKLVTYNTLDEDDVEFGVQLGCNGIVHILFEPIDPNQPDNPITLLEKCFLQRRNAVVVTLFSLKNFHRYQAGTCFFYDGENTFTCIELDDRNFKMIAEDSKTVLSNQSSLLKEYENQQLTAFIELLRPPVSLIIVGAGNDALPMMEMAAILGWQTTIIDGRASHANKQRFNKAHHIIVGKPGEAITHTAIDERTVFVLMTHNYNYDLAMLELLLQHKCKYIGTLGPKKRLERMLGELRNKGIILNDEQMATIYGPTGLDIGAETAEEIALSVLGEIKSVLSNREGSFLKNRMDVIHSRSTIDQKMDALQ
jgi:xanthine dehydrogenase accessory factor